MLTPFKLADAIYYKLGKPFDKIINKQERGLALKQAKAVLTALHKQGWEDHQIINLIDEAVFFMKQEGLPLVYRMLYSIIYSSVFNGKYVQQEATTATNYSEWIQQEVKRVKNSN